MKTNRQRAYELYTKLQNSGVSDQAILEHILNNFLSGDVAYEALLDTEREFFNDADDFYSEKDHDASSFDEE